MVLKTATAPKFEEMEDETADMAAAATEAEVEAPPAPAAPAKASAAVVKPVGGALAKKMKPMNITDHDVIAVLEGRLPPVDFGEGVRLVGSNGQIMDGDKKLMGDTVELLLLSWNNRYVVSPGGQGEAAKKAARYSLDGVITSQGENIEEYLNDLREGGYDKAALKTYIDLFGLMISQSDKKHVDHTGKSVSLSLSPDSVKLFNGFRRDLVVQSVTGRLTQELDPNTGIALKITTEIKSGNGNTWTRLVTALA